MSVASRRLIGIVDVAQIYAHNERVDAVVQRALHAGMRIFVLRAKAADISSVKSIAWSDIVHKIQEYKGVAILHDSLLAPCPNLASQSAFQHGSAAEIAGIAAHNFGLKPSHGVSSFAHRAEEPSTRIVSLNATFGASAHNAEELQSAEEAGAAWAFVSPVAASASKPNYGPHLGVEGVQRLVRTTSLPIFVLGGVTPQILADLKDAKIAGAVVMGVLTHPRATLQIKALLDQMESESWANPLPW